VNSYLQLLLEDEVLISSVVAGVSDQIRTFSAAARLIIAYGVRVM
jgi:hypothetical protein